MPATTSKTIADLLTERGRANELHDGVLSVAHHLPLSEFPDANWAFGLGPSRSHERTPYWNWLDSGDDPFSTRDGQARLLRLSYRPTSRYPSGWVRHSNFVAVRLGSDWDPEYDRDDDATVIPSPEAGLSSDNVAEKLLIGGPLCDPVVTSEPADAAGVIRAQLDRVSAGSQLNHVIEVITANASTYGYERDRDGLVLPDIEDLPQDLFAEDVDSASPLRVISGIGRTTVERFGSRFAVYPNLLNTDRSDFSGLLPGYDHNPDLDAMKELVAAFTERYRSLCTDPAWSGPTIDTDGFVEYPVGNPNYGRSI